MKQEKKLITPMSKKVGVDETSSKRGGTTSGRFQQFGTGCKSQSQRLPYNRLSDSYDILNHRQAMLQPALINIILPAVDSEEPA